MTDILCNWLNTEVKLSRRVDANNFAREFSSGYLVAEVLQKYDLQDDFDQFSQNKTANAKLANFTRLEPVLHLLEVPFDTNIARDMMTEKFGVATRLMYQVFIGLHRKTKANLTGVAMETMRPAAPVKLEAVESGIYKERLKRMTPRQTDLNLDALKARFHEKQIAMEKTAFKERFEEEERHYQDLQDHRQSLISKYKDSQAQKSEMLAKIQAATVHIPKPPPNRTARALAMQRELRKTREAEAMNEDITSFEDKMKRTIPPSKQVGEPVVGADFSDQLELIKPASNGEYIGKIRTRLEEDASARAEREKRRRKVLVDQLKAHEAQEEARREEMLVNRLMRQSQQERRIAVQLLQARHEKDIIRHNRILREKQYEQRRLKEFEDALNKEAEMARLAKLEYAEQTKKDRELHDQISQSRAEEKYRMHYDMANEILLGMVDFTCKIGEYRELTNKLLPAKQMRDWTALFVSGQPLYEAAPEMAVTEEELNTEKVLEEERQALLDEGDFAEYRNMMGEWQPADDTGVTGPPRNNPIVGHIVQRLFNIVHPPTPPPPPPEFPPFPIKACVLGKVFAGKSSCIKKLAEYHRLQVLCVDDLVAEAVEAHKTGELADNELDLPPRTAGSGRSVGDKTPAPPEGDNKETEERAATAKEEGMEKSDPEKPVPEDHSSQSLAVDNLATSRARLGAKAIKFLKRGKPVDDQLTIDIIVESIKRIPEEMGWVLDGFPSTYQQAKLLEKALTGMDSGDRKTGKSRKSNLAPDPRPTPPPAEPGSGINVVIMFDLDNELALKRSAGRTYATQADAQFHQEFNPPPDGSATGVGKQERVIPVEDAAHDMEQTQQRLTTFQDQWPKLEKWFCKFGTLRTVDASQEEKTVFLEVEKIFEDTLKKLRGEDQEESLPLESTEPKEEEKPAEDEKPAEAPAAEPPKEEESRSRPTSKKSRSGSAKRSTSRGSAKGDKSKSPGRADSKAGSGKKSPGKAGSRASSAKRGKSGKKGKTPEPEPEAAPEPPSTPLPVPGSDEWEFVDRDISDEMAKILAPQWDMVEKQYVDSSKVVFHSIREERERIIRYFYQIRKDFKAYLRRPDSKQEFVSGWQKEYNDLADDLRDDEESRAELHERVDDLRERLWSICDDRKSAAEGGRESVINDGWLEDHLGLLANYYITLAQGEVDRFQDTIRMLKDYYKAMEGKIPEEINQDLARIPLIELPVEGRPESAAASVASGEGGGTRPTTPADEVKSSTSKSGTPSGKKKKGADVPAEEPPADTTGEDGDKRSRIPLVPRRPMSPETAAAQAAAKGGKPEKGKGGKATEIQDAPPPPEDADDRLIYDAYITALTAIDRISNQIAAEQAAREAEEEAERARDLEKEKEKEKAAAATKGKGGKAPKGGKKSRSPSPKKGKASPAPTTPPPQTEETEEEKLNKKLNERARIEFFSALEEEAKAGKSRLNLIRVVAYGILNDLRYKADGAYKDMNDWLGARFLKEMESIDHMSEVMRNAIETSSHIKEELVIHQEDFVVNEDVIMPEFAKDLKVLRTPSPILRPPPIEPAYPDTFTVDQIMNLYQQFALTAPTGVLSIKAFQETFADLSALTHGTEQIPDIWMHIAPEKLDMMAAHLSPDGEYIDWRTLILATAHPWPRPSQSDLLDTLKRFTDMDQKHTGFVTREQFERVPLWFTTGFKPQTPANPHEPYPYDRVANLKKTFFDVFADHEGRPPQLDYVQMLLYFAAATDPYEGFLRALSIASGTHMPRLPRKFPRISRPSSQASLAPSIDYEADAAEEGVAEDIPEDAVNASVPLDALDRVLHHGQSMRGDSHRFSVTSDPEDAFSRDRLQGVFHDLCSDGAQVVPFSNLIEHPIIQDIASTLQTYKSVDLKTILRNPGSDPTDAHSIKTGE